MTFDAVETSHRITESLDSANQSYTDIDIIPPTLEDAFIHLVKTQRAS
jgi:hypothetical protein